VSKGYLIVSEMKKLLFTRFLRHRSSKDISEDCLDSTRFEKHKYKTESWRLDSSGKALHSSWDQATEEREKGWRCKYANSPFTPHDCPIGGKLQQKEARKFGLWILLYVSETRRHSMTTPDIDDMLEIDDEMTEDEFLSLVNNYKVVRTTALLPLACINFTIR